MPKASNPDLPPNPILDGHIQELWKNRSTDMGKARLREFFEGFAELKVDAFPYFARAVEIKRPEFDAMLTSIVAPVGR